MATQISAPIPLPVPVCSIVGSVLGNFFYSQARLERLFYEAGAVGEAPEGNCVQKCQTWLKRMHILVPDATAVLGKVLEEFMEVDSSYKPEEQNAGRQWKTASKHLGLDPAAVEDDDLKKILSGRRLEHQSGQA